MMAEFSRFKVVLEWNQGQTDGPRIPEFPWIEPNFEMKFDEYNDILPKWIERSKSFSHQKFERKIKSKIFEKKFRKKFDSFNF